LPEIARITHVPIATGERMFTVAEFSDVVARQGAHILQPDLVHVGGIANAAEVAALAEANGIAFAPHCPLSPIAFMACLQVVVHSRAGWILEWSKGIHYNSAGALAGVDPWLRYIEPREWRNFDVDPLGHLDVPELPGLGVTINWREVETAAREGSRWRDELMRLPDNTISNW
jgi:galactonate dehydratase